MRSSDNQVISEFQRRRRRMIHNFGFSLLLFALGLILMQLRDSCPDFLGVGHAGWSAAAMAQLIAGVVFALIGFQQYRCPVCNEIVKAHDKYYFGVAMDPSNCPKCGANLKK